MGEIRSAWEIAQQRADKLGKLSAKEQRQQKEQNCRQIGQALAQKYFDLSQPQNIATELSKYADEENQLIRQAFITCLAEAIDLRSPSRLEKIARGILKIAPESGETLEQITQLSREYEQAGGKIRREIESNSKETLHQMGISGTAVGKINIEATPKWQRNLSQITQTFQERLDGLKQELWRLRK